MVHSVYCLRKGWCLKQRWCLCFTVLTTEDYCHFALCRAYRMHYIHSHHCSADIATWTMSSALVSKMTAVSVTMHMCVCVCMCVCVRVRGPPNWTLLQGSVCNKPHSLPYNQHCNVIQQYYRYCFSLHRLTAVYSVSTAHLNPCHDVIWKRPIKVQNLKPLSLFVYFFALACKRISIKMPSTENNVIGQENTVFRCVRKIQFSGASGKYSFQVCPENTVSRCVRKIQFSGVSVHFPACKFYRLGQWRGETNSLQMRLAKKSLHHFVQFRTYNTRQCKYVQIWGHCTQITPQQNIQDWSKVRKEMAQNTKCSTCTYHPITLLNQSSRTKLKLNRRWVTLVLWVDGVDGESHYTSLYSDSDKLPQEVMCLLLKSDGVADEELSWGRQYLQTPIAACIRIIQ